MVLIFFNKFIFLTGNNILPPERCFQYLFFSLNHVQQAFFFLIFYSMKLN